MFDANYFLQKFLSNNIHNDDVAFLEDELKRFKTIQNVDDDEATKRRKDVLKMARQERLIANGDRSSDDEIKITGSIGINNENSNDDDDDDEDFDRSSMKTTQKRTQSSTKTTTRGATRGRGRGRAKTTTTTTTPRGKKKPF